LQGKLDDSGWGCAYRSLQTIASWFLAQNFTDKPIPSHHEIQQVLVDIGQLQSTFLSAQGFPVIGLHPALKIRSRRRRKILTLT